MVIAVYNGIWSQTLNPSSTAGPVLTPASFRMLHKDRPALFSSTLGNPSLVHPATTKSRWPLQLSGSCSCTLLACEVSRCCYCCCCCSCKFSTSCWFCCCSSLGFSSSCCWCRCSCPIWLLIVRFTIPTARPVFSFPLVGYYGLIRLVPSPLMDANKPLTGRSPTPFRNREHETFRSVGPQQDDWSSAGLQLVVPGRGLREPDSAEGLIAVLCLDSSAHFLRWEGLLLLSVST